MIKAIHQKMNRKWTVASVDKFYGKTKIHSKMRWDFILKLTERTWVQQKTVLRISEIALSFKRSAYFYVAITGDFERFQYFNFKKI